MRIFQPDNCKWLALFFRKLFLDLNDRSGNFELRAIVQFP